MIRPIRLGIFSSAVVINFLLLFSALSICADSPRTNHYKQGLNYALDEKFAVAKEEFKEALKKDKSDRGSQEALQIIDGFDKRTISKEFLLLQFKGIKSMFKVDTRVRTP